MSWKGSVEAQVTFSDASAYFSEEEWTLLQEWQRELYRNVMKEIHQALISLGPLIATTVCSLRDKEKEEMCVLDTISHSTENEADSCHIDHQESKKMKGNGCPMEFQYANANMYLRKEDRSVKGHDETGVVGEISTCSGNVVSTSEVSFCIKSEGESYAVDHLDCGRREAISSPKVIDQFHIKEEQDTSSMDHPNSERVMDINCSVGDGFLNGQCTDTDGVTCTRNTQPFISSSGEANGKTFQSSKELPDYKSQVWPQNHLELEAKKTMLWSSDSGYLTHDNVLQCLTKTGISYAYNECQSNLRNAVLSTYHQRAKQVPGPYVCTQYEKNLRQNGALTTLKKSQTNIRLQERPYACTICKKSFSVKCDLNRHWRTHTGEKPYTCPDCQKSFSQKGDLNRHQRAHAGEKPYTCAFCQKSFSRKDILNEHRRIHTGGRKMLSRKDQKS